MIARLNRENALHLPENVISSSYSRERTASVVHIGPGAFHRAHQAAYFDALMALSDESWMIENVSLRSPRAVAALAPQDGLYILKQNSKSGSLYRLIRSINEMTDGAKSANAAIMAVARPETKIITLTITEKGYDDIGAGSAADILAGGLEQRRKAGLAGLTILSCDNLPSNGEAARRAVLCAAAANDQNLSNWIENEVLFPSSMVDRITPATTEEDKRRLATELGLRDEGHTVTEQFSQWVIEDSFVGDRPALDLVGVQFTYDVQDWETVKLRLLNGAHSAIAYLGGLSGYKFVHEAIADRQLRDFVNALWDEIEKTLPKIADFDVAAYRTALLARFDNSSLNHRLMQIAADGSRKIPQRLVAPLIERSTLGLGSPAICLAIAAWMRWQAGKLDDGSIYEVDDPLAGKLSAALELGRAAPEAIVRNFLNISEVFPRDRLSDESYINSLTCQFVNLYSHGACAAVAKCFESNGP